MIAFWGLLVWLIYARVTTAPGSSSRGNDAGTAEQILDKRLARGEIDTDEYARLRATLTSDQRSTRARSAN